MRRSYGAFLENTPAGCRGTDRVAGPVRADDVLQRAAEVRRQLIAQKGYTDDALPTVQTLTTKLNALGYYPKKVAKSQPQKKFQKPTPSSRR